MRIDAAQTAKRLLEQDRVLVLLHQYPDGDTIGAGCALCAGLQSLGKQAGIACNHTIPERYGYITRLVRPMEFEPEFIVAADVADPKLLGDKLAHFGSRVNLCIDHHGSNKLYAKETYLHPGAAATCEMMAGVLAGLGVTVDAALAAALYTGIATDTGCFKYSNTTAKTHFITAKLMETGMEIEEINRVMFDTKTKNRVLLERMAMDGMEFAFDDRCAIITITRAMREQSNTGDDDLEGITTLPRQIEGVLAGVTIREQTDGRFKASVRTHPPLDAAAICARLGGGGHPNAAGCTLEGTLEEAREALKSAVKEQLDERIFTH